MAKCRSFARAERQIDVDLGRYYSAYSLFAALFSGSDGTREGGDDYVLAMLEIVVADQSKISASEKLKIALYRLLLEIWMAAPINAHADHSGAQRE